MSEQNLLDRLRMEPAFPHFGYGKGDLAYPSPHRPGTEEK
jgi:hypothetical protein